MANRYPLIVDSTDGNKLKEIPSGDNLQLTGNSIIGVTDVTASGTIAASILSAASIMKGGTEISSVAVSGSYTDLSSRPTLLSDFTNDLNLLEVGGNIGQLVNNVGYITASDLTNMTIDVNNTGDLIGSVFSDDSTVMIDSILSAVNLDGTIRGHVSPNANQHNLWDIGFNAIRFKNAYFQGTVDATAFVGDGSGLTGISGGGSVGNFTLASSVIDTDDSSGITITPAVTVSSDLNVENDLRVTNIVYADRFESTNSGAPTLTSESVINLSATDRVTINRSPLNFASFTDTQRDALTAVNGDMIYNTTNNRPEMYVNGAWKIIDTSPIV